jgi:hypothetical protein
VFLVLNYKLICHQRKQSQITSNRLENLNPWYIEMFMVHYTSQRELPKIRGTLDQFEVLSYLHQLGTSRPSDSRIESQVKLVTATHKVK